MTRKVFTLLMLSVVVLLGSTFAGCGRPTKDQQLASAKIQIANLEGQLASQRDMAGDNQDLRADLAQTQQELSSAQMEMNRLRAEAQNVTSTAAVPGMTIPGDVLFAPGQATLTSGGKSALNSVVGTLKSRYAGRQISVEGHTDSSPLRVTKDKWKTNVWLSCNRAWSVAYYLIGQGIPENTVSVVGRGTTQPKGGSQAQDRRVEIVVQQ